MANLPPLNREDLPTPEEMARIEAALEDLKYYVQEMRNEVIEDKTNFMTAGGTTEEHADVYHAKQQARVEELMRMQAVLREFAQRVEDTQLVLAAHLFEKAKIVHQALREASKTDPSLKEAVAELDALYEEALREQEEE